MDLMQLMSFTHLTKREMDSGQKAGYYTAILSGEMTAVYGAQVLQSSVRAPFLLAQKVIYIYI